MIREAVVSASRAGVRGLLVLTACAALACAESSAVTGISVPSVAAALEISAPVLARGVTLPVSPQADTGPALIAFVSARPQSLPAAGTSAIITSLASGHSSVTAIVDGGFDPVPLQARAGDSVRVVVLGGHDTVAAAVMMVPARRRPVVTRSIPTHGGTDIPLNNVIIIVFSEPVDSSSVNSTTVMLLQGSTPVAVALRFADATHVSVALSAVSALEPHTAYRLVATTGVSDLLGATLDSTFEADFSTGTATAGPPASITILPETVTVTPGSSVQFLAEVRDGHGAIVPNVSVGWTSDTSYVAQISGTGRATTLDVLGSATITATAGTIAATARMTVVRPPAPSNLVFASISAGRGYACGVTTSGRAYCWGNGYSGKLGDGTAASSTTPVAVLGGHSFSSVSAGVMDTCGITPSDQAFCWGDNHWGGLGNGQVDSPSTCCSRIPVAVAGGLSFTSLSTSNTTASEPFTCGVTVSGQGYCWGFNQAGVLFGGGAISSSPVPVASGITFASLSAGADHVCGLTPSGQAYCWGNSSLGRLGNGDTAGTPHPMPQPSLVAGGIDFVSVSASFAFTCGIMGSGAGYCWGADWATFPTSDTSATDCEDNVCTAYFPRPASLDVGLKLTAISVQQVYSCGLTGAGQAFCWGPNPVGNLGDGTTTDSRGAVPVAGGLNFTSISLGDYFACGVTASGTAYCWGNNRDGQLGNGTTANSSVPVKVVGQP